MKQRVLWPRVSAHQWLTPSSSSLSSVCSRLVSVLVSYYSGSCAAFLLSVKPTQSGDSAEGKESRERGPRPSPLTPGSLAPAEATVAPQASELSELAFCASIRCRGEAIKWLLLPVPTQAWQRPWKTGEENTHTPDLRSPSEVDLSIIITA